MVDKVGGGEGGTVGQDPAIKILWVFFGKDLNIAQKGQKPRKLDDKEIYGAYRLIES